MPIANKYELSEVLEACDDYYKQTGRRVTFEYSLVAGLTASGADAYLLHVTTTPSVAYIARVDDL